jgi:hypothetical protein
MHRLYDGANGFSCTCADRSITLKKIMVTWSDGEGVVYGGWGKLLCFSLFSHSRFKVCEWIDLGFAFMVGLIILIYYDSLTRGYFNQQGAEKSLNKK